MENLNALLVLVDVHVTDVEGSYEVGIDEEYRFTSDQSNVTRIKQNPPNKLGKKIFENISVAGVSDELSAENANNLISGKNRRIELEKEPNNPYDQNAIKVIGYWEDVTGRTSGQIGYLPKEVASEIASKYQDSDIGASIHIMYSPTKQKSPGFRINIWTTKAKPRKGAEIPLDSSIAVPTDPVERNLKGYELEKNGYIENAIRFYQANVEENFQGTYPYERLSIIYRKRGDYKK